MPLLPSIALLLLAGCRSQPGADPATRDRLDALLAFPAAEGPLELLRFAERSHDLDGYRVTPVRYRLRPGFSVAAALYEPDVPTGAGIILAHGHFGQGKSGAEAQEPAHRLAARGYTVLAVDTPGVEEWEVPGRRIHFDEGAHERAFLVAGGSSALALQMAILRRGVDVLESIGVSRLAATGASGGAVQSFYLMLADRRLKGAVMASFVPLPREARAGGCPCDQLPGWSGPDPALLRLVDRPTLWLADAHDDRPPGLPRSGRFVRLESPHSYDRAMQQEAIAFLDDLLDVEGGPLREQVPLLDLQTPGPALEQGWESIFDLPLSPPAGHRWRPEARTGSSGRLGFELDCQGKGPTILLAGGGAEDRAALLEAGARACRVQIQHDEVGLAEGVAAGIPYAARISAALQDAARVEKARAIYAVRAWALPAAGSGLPYGVRDPVRSIEELDIDRDPAWIHVPGAWWGGLEPVWAGAVVVAEEPGAVAAALVRPYHSP